MRFIRRVNQDDVPNPGFRNDAANPINQIAVGIKDGDTLTTFDVLLNEVEKQSRFSRSACPYDMAVPYPLLRRQSNRSGFASVFIISKEQSLLPSDYGRGRLGFDGLPLKHWRTDGTRRQMHE